MNTEIKKIDFFTAVNQYSSVLYFTREFIRAWEAKGVRCRVFDLEDGCFRDHLNTLIQDPPDLTCSFNYLCYGKGDTWLCDSLRLPHLTYGLDGANYSIDHFEHPFAMISMVDQLDWQGLKMIGEQRALFLPHAIEKDYPEPSYRDRPYDLIFCGTFIDYLEEMDSWSSRFIPPICEMMELACRIILEDPSFSIAIALEHAKMTLDVDLTGVDLVMIYGAVEKYCKGRDRVELIESLQDYKIHIFGSQEGKGTRDWRHQFSGSRNIIYHGPVSFEDSLQLFQKSKIILNSAPQFRHGSHERIFYGLASGGVVVTNENPYLQEQFSQNHGLLYYHPSHTDRLKQQVHQLLSEPNALQEQALKGRHIVMTHHTWDNRIHELQKHWRSIDFSQVELDIFAR